MRPIFLLLSIFIALTAQSQEVNGTIKDCPPKDVEHFNTKNRKIKALYLYEFSSEIEFQEKTKSKEFKVAFLNGEKLKEHFDFIVEGKKDSHISSYLITNLKDITKYHMVYIDCDYEIDIDRLRKKLGKSNTLIITDNPELSNLMINFRVENCKIFYELNKEALVNQGIFPTEDMVQNAKNYM